MERWRKGCVGDDRGAGAGEGGRRGGGIGEMGEMRR